MDELGKFLAGQDSADDTADAAVDTKAKDVKPADKAEKPGEAASASSAEKGTEEGDKSKADKAEDEPTEGRARNEKGQFTKKEATDEVSKLRAENAGLKTALSQTRAKGRERKPEKDPFTDLPGALDERTDIIRTEVQQRNFELLEEIFVNDHPDYAEVVDGLITEGQTDPSVAAAIGSLLGQKNPPKALYQFAKHRKVLDAFGGDLTKYNASIEKPHLDRIKQLETELVAEREKFKNLSSVPSSLSRQGSASSAQVAQDAADRDTPLDDIVKPRKRKHAA